jgi:hypothetical protein
VSHRVPDPLLEARLRDPVFAEAYRLYVDDLRRQALELTARRKRSPRTAAFNR